MLPSCRLAFRNIFRFKRRTFITFFATSFGLALLIITISLMNGIDKDSISNIINCQTSHIKIFKQGYFDRRNDFPMGLTIRDPQRYYPALLQIPGVQAVESRILFAATMIKGADELPCLGVAVETDRDPEIFNIKESILQGDWLQAGDSMILVGEDLAEDMGLAVGDSLTLRMITANEKENFNWNAMDIEVKGIFASGNPTVDGGRIIIPMAVAREGLSLASQSTEIVVRLASDDDKLIDTVKARIEKEMNGAASRFEFRSWKELASSFLAVSEMKTKNSSIIIFIMLLIASVGIVNTMLMTVMERTREIGMLAALGMKKREIMILFICEGGFIGLIGSILGCVIGGLTSWYLEVRGFSITSWGETMSRMSESIYPVKGVFYADLTFSVLLMVFAFGTIIALLASAYPARKAANMDPIKALRHI
jgi:putative ABC transport system permease protein